MTDPAREDSDRLEQAIASLGGSSLQANPPEDLVTSTVEVLQQKEKSVLASADSAGHLGRRDLMFRFVKYGSLGTAASIAMVVAGVLIFNGLASRPAFAQVIQNVREATGARYFLKQKIGSQPAIECVSSFQGDLVRTEVPQQFIHVVNVRTRDMLQLVPALKVAYQGKLDDRPLDGPLDLATVMKEMTEDAGERTETVEEEGRRLDVYRVSKLPTFFGKGTLKEDDDFRIWVDRKTQLPVLIKLRMNAGPKSKASAIEMEFSKFQWNPEFDPKTFDMSVPEGYEVKPLPKTP